MHIQIAPNTKRSAQARGRRAPPGLIETFFNHSRTRVPPVMENDFFAAFFWHFAFLRFWAIPSPLWGSEQQEGETKRW